MHFSYFLKLCLTFLEDCPALLKKPDFMNNKAVCILLEYTWYLSSFFVAKAKSLKLGIL
jgi:hypothetical protein